VTFNHSSAGMSYFPWDRLSDVGDWLVVAFGMIVCITCIFSVSYLGIRAMFPRQYRRAKHKRRKRQERSA
jgi:hypothetical protein